MQLVALLRRLILLWLLCLCYLAAQPLHAAIAGHYYSQNNIDNNFFAGTLVTRTDANVDFDWGGGSPVGGIGNNRFSIRWIGEVEVPTSGTYTFVTVTDDGVRLWVNGVQLIDSWVDQTNGRNTGTLTGLVAGQRYNIMMEYYERTGQASAELRWIGPGISEQVIPAGNLFLDSTPPSVISAGSLCLNGELVVNFSESVTAASAENLANYSADTGVVITGATLAPGGNSVTLNYFAGNGTLFNLTVRNISDTNGNVMGSPQNVTITAEPNGLLGQYFDQNGVQRAYFTGNVIERVDANVDFLWGGGIPITGMGGDDFSIRWQGEVTVPSSGTYTFYTVSDDGVRLYLDGNLIINNWTDHSSTTNTSAGIPLNAGQRYPLVMEFYERGVEAEARLQWSSASISRQAIPNANLFVSCASTVPNPVGLWHLEEATWSGAADEVEDATGNGLNGRAINVNALPTTETTSPAIAGNPGTCGYGQFDGTADGYVQIDDAGSSLLDMPSEVSMTAWIYPTALPTGANLATVLSKDTNYEIHLDSAGRVYWWWDGGSNELRTTGSVTLNAWNHIAFTYTSGAQVIYINGQTAATRQNTGALTTNDLPLYIGVDYSFDARRFSGYIDEVQLYDAALSSFDVATIRAQTHACASSPLDHFIISHSGTGLTCEAEAVTIGAHDASHVAVDVAGNTIVVDATSTSPGWSASDTRWTVIAGSGSLSTPSPGRALYTFASGESAVTLGLGNSSVASIDIDVSDQANSALRDMEGSAEDPLLSFLDTGLRFYNDANGDGNADGTDPIAAVNTAGVTSTPFVLRAVRTNDETGACEARLLGAQTVQLAYECVDPGTCASSNSLQMAGGAIAHNNSGGVASYSNVPLTFDAQGEVPLTLNYADVGQIRLHARLPLAASGPDPALTLTGSSGLTVVRPYDLVISAITTPGGSPNPGSTGSGAGFVAAGSNFRVVVQAQNALGALTPAFGTESAPEGLLLNGVALVMPSSGNFPPLSGAAGFSATGTGGEFVNAGVSWSEVGTLTLNASLVDGSYLGTGNVSGSVSGNVGRFFPNHLRLVSHSLVPGCAAAGFSFMSDQLFNYRPLDVAYTLQAESPSNAVLQNYDAALGYPVESLSTVAENADDGINLAARALLPGGTWEDGVMAVSGGDNGGFARALSGTSEVPDGPLNALQFGLRVLGSGPDGVNFLSGNLNMNAGTAGACGGGCNAAAIGGAQVFRFARLAGNNAHGPDTAPLALPLAIQYWDGSAFVSAGSDSCSTLPMSAIRFNGNSLSTDANRTVAIGAGSTTGSFALFNPGVDMGFINGDAGLSFSAPGAGNLGGFDVDIDLSTLPWLRYDWNQDGNHADDAALPSLNVRFGRYRGHDRVIYWQEVLE